MYVTASDLENSLSCDITRVTTIAVLQILQCVLQYLFSIVSLRFKNIDLIMILEFGLTCADTISIAMLFVLFSTANKIAMLFGRPFVKRFTLCYRTVVLSVLYCGLTVGWIKMPFGTEVGLGSGDIVLDGDPAARGTAARLPPLIRPMSFVAKRLDESR